jgi:hypothetical protein
MLVLFDDEVHWVVNTHILVKPSSTSGSGSKKRKSSDLEEIYILVNCKDENSIKEEIAVNASDCTDLRVYISVEDSLSTFIEHNLSSNTSSDRIKWTVSYRSPKNKENKDYKEYRIYSIQAILKDSLVVEIQGGEIRRFKFDHLVENCGDGLIYD